MKDILSDIVSHTNKLGLFNMVKITGTKEKISIDAMAEDRTVVMFAETVNPHPELLGIFGMPQLEKLRYLVDGKEYQEDAQITLIKDKRNQELIPVGLHFENKDGDFKNDYRFMNQDVINEKLKTVTFKGVKWHVEISPTLSSIQRFNFQAGANTEHTTFRVKTQKGQLVFKFGDVNSHGGEFVFSSDIKGNLTKEWSWPILPVLNILKAADVNNTLISFSDDGAMQITLDSGIATYKYIVPAQT